ncbi:hypothetical protein NPIL_691921 [Nephila pilipes]|uniref:Uncharacterized protein n=1 Tax=Nephila pilipes TaxID=299642 RepID=A0A8X6TT74_NEPPI|nr:hypothetical protein NPIL_691921 [Nephila pilipes]
MKVMGSQPSPSLSALFGGDETERRSQQCGHATGVAIFHRVVTWRRTPCKSGTPGASPDTAEKPRGTHCGGSSFLRFVTVPLREEVLIS